MNINYNFNMRLTITILLQFLAIKILILILIKLVKPINISLFKHYVMINASGLSSEVGERSSA